MKRFFSLHRILACSLLVISPLLAPLNTLETINNQLDELIVLQGELDLPNNEKILPEAAGIKLINQGINLTELGTLLNATDDSAKNIKAKLIAKFKLEATAFDATNPWYVQFNNFLGEYDKTSQQLNGMNEKRRQTTKHYNATSQRALRLMTSLSMQENRTLGTFEFSHRRFFTANGILTGLLLIIVIRGAHAECQSAKTIKGISFNEGLRLFMRKIFLPRANTVNPNHLVVWARALCALLGLYNITAATNQIITHRYATALKTT